MESLGTQPFPPELYALVMERSKPRQVEWTQDRKPEKVSQGARHQALTRLAAALRSQGLSLDAILSTIKIENQKRFDPPMDDESEIERVVHWAMSAVEPDRDVISHTLYTRELQERFGSKAEEEKKESSDDFLADVPQSILAVAAKNLEYYTTGLKGLDKLLGGGLERGSLTIIAAPPGSGKTALGIFFLTKQAGKRPVLYVSTELIVWHILARRAAITSGIPYATFLKNKDDNQETILRCTKDTNEYYLGPEKLFKDPSISPIEIIKKAIKQIKAKHPEQEPLVIIDYLQNLMPTFDQSRYSDTSTVTRQLSQLAIDEQINITALSSISRGYYSAGKSAEIRKNLNPSDYLAASKESGEIDFAAAQVVYIDLEKPEDNEDYRAGKIVVAKSRNGRTGFAKVKFYGATNRFEDHEEPDEPKPTKHAGGRPAQDMLADRAQKVIAVIQKHGPSTRTKLKEASNLHTKDLTEALSYLIDTSKIRLAAGSDKLWELQPISPPPSPPIKPKKLDPPKEDPVIKNFMSKLQV